MDTLQLGQTVVQLGGGRIQKNDKIDFSTGIRFHKKIGEFVEKGAPLLEYFCSDPIKFELGENLLKNIWDYDYYGGTRTVDVHVRRLRRKIEDHKNNFIETIWNVGYKFNENKAGNSNE